jgi:hypothetical protein
MQLTELGRNNPIIKDSADDNYFALRTGRRSAPKLSRRIPPSSLTARKFIALTTRIVPFFCLLRKESLCVFSLRLGVGILQERGENFSNRSEVVVSQKSCSKCCAVKQAEKLLKNYFRIFIL